jgi:hypothetical protein
MTIECNHIPKPTRHKTRLDMSGLTLAKKVRQKNRTVLDEVKQQPCSIPGCPYPADPSHIKTVGAGGADTGDNVKPLCRFHHTEWHTIGRITFCRKYVLDWLK